MTYADGSKSAISATIPIVDGCEECVDVVNESGKQLGGDLFATLAAGLQARKREDLHQKYLDYKNMFAGKPTNWQGHQYT